MSHPLLFMIQHSHPWLSFCHNKDDWMIEHFGGFATAYSFGSLVFFIDLIVSIGLKKEGI
ncbi:hypothetical protein AM501_02720 [Aneurinibacillus migulanus]|nr:hypothetical protein TS64_09005 [Aneurinibacillus migulanus]KPD09708.1 hypothetical protein AM501_02720 [Aneurinibacillus migulanus]